MSVQNGPRTFGLTSPQFVWQNADTNCGFDLLPCINDFLILNGFVEWLPPHASNEDASSLISLSASAYEV